MITMSLNSIFHGNRLQHWRVDRIINNKYWRRILHFNYDRGGSLFDAHLEFDFGMRSWNNIKLQLNYCICNRISSDYAEEIHTAWLVSGPVQEVGLGSLRWARVVGWGKATGVFFFLAQAGSKPGAASACACAADVACVPASTHPNV